MTREDLEFALIERDIDFDACSIDRGGMFATLMVTIKGCEYFTRYVWRDANPERFDEAVDELVSQIESKK